MGNEEISPNQKRGEEGKETLAVNKYWDCHHQPRVQGTKQLFKT